MKRVNLLIKAILSLVLAVLAVLMAWQELLAGGWQEGAATNSITT